MKWDEFAFAIQNRIDRIIRWARLVPSYAGDYRRFIIIQIDGLSYSTLIKALRKKRMPFTARLLERGAAKLKQFSCGLPSSTPAFQAGIMYGETIDIPGFHWYDKRRNVDMYIPALNVSTMVEQRHAEGRPGILKDGTSYGCIFGGEAETAVVNFSRLTAPNLGLNLSTIRFFLPNFIILWVVVKIAFLSAIELIKGLYRIVIDLVRGRLRFIKFKLILFKIIFSIVIRQLFTLGVSHDIYRGIPAIYVNFVGYDVFAHGNGPEHKRSLGVLKEIDSSIRQIYRAARRAPEFKYDLFILSDHGQVASIPFEQVSGGVSFKDLILTALINTRLEGKERRLEIGEEQKGKWAWQISLISRIGSLRRSANWPLSVLCQRYLQYLRSSFCKKLNITADLNFIDQVVIIPAGPNAFIYFTHTQEKLTVEQIEELYPGLINYLSGHPGIGLILAADRDGPVLFHRRNRFRIDPETETTPDNPFHDRPDLAIVMEGLARLIYMPGSGDLTVLGHYAPAGNISYVGEYGSHAGPSEEEMKVFIIHPPDVDYRFEDVTRPGDLYRFFINYRLDRERQLYARSEEQYSEPIVSA